MKILILPDDREQLPSKIKALDAELAANGHEPTETQRMQQRLKELTSLRASTRVYRYTPPPCDKVEIGTVATLENREKTRIFSIAGVMTFTSGRLPSTDPIARVLLGKAVCDQVQIEGEVYAITSIQPISCT